MSSFWIFFTHESTSFNYRPLTGPLDPLFLVSTPNMPGLWMCSLLTSPKRTIPSLFVSSFSTLRWLGMVNVFFPVCWDSQTKWKNQKLDIWTQWILENTAASSLVKLTHRLNWALGHFALQSPALVRYSFYHRQNTYRYHGDFFSL